MAEPGAPSATIAQLTTTSGIGAYVLGTPIRDKLPISAAYNNGDMLRYKVTDTSGMQEIAEGLFTSPNILSRDTLIISSTGGFVNWPSTGQRVVTPIVRLPICDATPVIGQILTWNGTEWCPGDITAPTDVPLCPIAPITGEVLVWNALENAYCPADLCTLVTACMTPLPPACNWEWTNRSTLGVDTWNATATSDDGLLLAAIAHSNLWISVDGGVTWSHPTVPSTSFGYAWVAVTKPTPTTSIILILAAAGHLSRSTDLGVSWTNITPIGATLDSEISISTDGNTIIAADSGVSGYPWTTTNGGVSWTHQTTPFAADAWTVAGSRDGSTFSVRGGTGFYYSHDSGVSWTASSAGGSSGQILTAVNNDGSVILAVKDSPALLQFSTDGGATFADIATAPTNWRSVAVSGDGQTFVAGNRESSDRHIYVSCDQGTTWNLQSDSGTGAWFALAISDDGQTIIAAVNGADVWTGIHL